MQRGSRTLFTEIFADAPSLVTEGMGRNSDLLDRRNECLIDRYVYYYYATGWNYPILLKAIATDFFLTERRVTDVLQICRVSLSKARSKKATKAELEKKWPQMSWAVPVLQQYL